jgi:hypothetical protein
LVSGKGRDASARDTTRRVAIPAITATNGIRKPTPDHAERFGKRERQPRRSQQIYLEINQIITG